MGGNPLKAAGNALGTVFTGGLNQIPGRSNPFRKIGNTAGDVLTLGSSRLGQGGSGGAGVGPAGGQDPLALLTSTGGAPILANIVMGADPDEAIAGFLGIPKAEMLDALAGRNSILGTPEQAKATVSQIMGVRNQLSSIQNDRQLRQQAVDKVLNDFPNLTKQAAQARMDAGGEFDSVTKGYMEQALGKTAAQYAAGGNLSSGAANEAFAKTGADMALQKLDYMGNREQNSYNQGANELNARLSEVNALRDFQNTMLTGQVTNGFSATQANLQRQFQGQMQANDISNQQNMADKQSQNALFGAVGGLAGSFAGAKLLSGSSLFGSPSSAPAPRLNTTNIGGGDASGSWSAKV